MAKIVKIEGLFDGLGRRFLSDAPLQRNTLLIAQGWERRFTADEQRAKEAMELYSELGYEVRAEPVLPEELQDDCQDCKTVVSFYVQTVYTRKKLVRGPAEENL
jgi:hypothetical protein